MNSLSFVEISRVLFDWKRVHRKIQEKEMKKVYGNSDLLPVLNLGWVKCPHCNQRMKLTGNIFGFSCHYDGKK